GRQDAALTAFLATCPRFASLDDHAPVGPAYAGVAGPWKRACSAAAVVHRDAASARAFFESAFTPWALEAEGADTGLVTAYYEPQIEVRWRRERPYLEPIIRAPANLETVAAPASDRRRGVREEVFLRAPSGALTLAPPRKEIRRDARAQDVVAYGRLS